MSYPEVVARLRAADVALEQFRQHQQDARHALAQATAYADPGDERQQETLREIRDKADQQEARAAALVREYGLLRVTRILREDARYKPRAIRTRPQTRAREHRPRRARARSGSRGDPPPEPEPPLARPAGSPR